MKVQKRLDIWRAEYQPTNRRPERFLELLALAACFQKSLKWDNLHFFLLWQFKSKL